MPYITPYLPASPPAEVRLAQGVTQSPPGVEPAPVRAQDLQAQNPGQATDLQGVIDSSPLLPKEDVVPLGGPIKDGGEQILLDADIQQYDQINQVFTARGNVQMQFRTVKLTADEIRVDLKDRIAVAEGSIVLTQGKQKLSGSRLEYNFTQEQGVLADASGTINTKTLNQEINGPLVTDLVSLQNRRESPPTTGGILTFAAARIVFSPEGWKGQEIRVSPDQFDPPEIELRTPEATVRRTGPAADRLTINGGQLVFNQSTFLPVPAYTTVISNERRKAPSEVGSDSFDKGGLYYQQNFDFLIADNAELTISPQLYIQQALGARPFLSAENTGLQTKLSVSQAGGQITRLFAEINGLVFNEISNRLRARIEHVVPVGDNRLTFSYGYRERFFNGVLGFQTVAQSYGVNWDSASIPIGDTGINFSYQGSVSFITADSDQPDLNGRPELGRYRVAAAASKTIPLFVDQASPPTREFLRYSARPITPGLWLDVGTSYIQSWYSSGDAQSYLAGGASLRTVIGRFVRDSLDYTALNVGYTSGFVGGTSPFLFDRIGSRELISAGILQQVWGPFRAGVQTIYDPLRRQTVDTYYTLNFDYRTYGLSLTYNPVRQIGGIQLRVDEFNWGTNPGGRPDQVTDVVNGVERFNRNYLPNTP